MRCNFVFIAKKLQFYFLFQMCCHFILSYMSVTTLFFVWEVLQYYFYNRPVIDLFFVSEAMEFFYDTAILNFYLLRFCNLIFGYRCVVILYLLAGLFQFYCWFGWFYCFIFDSRGNAFLLHISCNVIFVYRNVAHLFLLFELLTFFF